VNEPPSILVQVLRLRADAWRRAHLMQVRASLWLAGPGLICGVGVLITDAPWWLTVWAVSAIVSSVATVVHGGTIYWTHRHEAILDRAAPAASWVGRRAHCRGR